MTPTARLNQESIFLVTVYSCETWNTVSRLAFYCKTQSDSVSKLKKRVSICNLWSLADGKRNNVLRNVDSAKRKHGDNTLCKFFDWIHLSVGSVCYYIRSMAQLTIGTITIREQLIVALMQLSIYTLGSYHPFGPLRVTLFEREMSQSSCIY